MSLFVAAALALVAPGAANAAYGLLSSQSGMGGSPMDVNAIDQVIALADGSAGGGPFGIVIYDRTGRVVGGFGDNGTMPPEPWVSGLDLAADPDNNIWVADTSHDQILKFSPAGKLLTQVGGSGTGDAQFRYPIGIAADQLGNVYVADALNNRVQKFSSSGTLLTKWGTPGSAPGQFGHPAGVDVGLDGTVFVSDWSNGRYQAFTSNGELIRVFGQTSFGEDPTDQPPPPRPVAATDDGSVFVMDSYSGLRTTVARFGPTGALAENFGCPGPGNRPLALATRNDEVFVGRAQESPSDHRPGVPSRVEVYGEGGVGWQDLCPPPFLSLRTPAKQRASDLKATVTCPGQACTVRLGGSLKRNAERGRDRIALEAVDVPLEKGVAKTVQLSAKRPRLAAQLAREPKRERRHWRAEIVGVAKFAFTVSPSFPEQANAKSISSIK
jgi:sugar lactone lactonase YvrE